MSIRGKCSRCSDEADVVMVGGARFCADCLARELAAAQAEIAKLTITVTSLYDLRQRYVQSMIENTKLQTVVAKMCGVTTLAALHAIEEFTDRCTSGHRTEEHIQKMLNGSAMLIELATGDRRCRGMELANRLEKWATEIRAAEAIKKEPQR